MSYIFDSHAHYDDERFDNVEALISEMSSGNYPVRYIVNAASDISSSLAAMKLAEKFEQIYFAAGIHPHEAEKAPSDYAERLIEFFSHEKCVALGEIGLDYHYDFSPRETQKRIFSEQLALAKSRALPVIIHDREAHSDTYELIKASGCSKGVIHSFSASAEFAREYIKLGFFISFSGSVTFKNAHNLAVAAQSVPDDSLLIETDAPYLAPVPYRGKTNRSDYALETAKKLAEIRGDSLEHILSVSALNAKALFGIL